MLVDRIRGSHGTGYLLESGFDAWTVPLRDALDQIAAVIQP
jgi:hypothetical protein